MGIALGLENKGWLWMEVKMAVLGGGGVGKSCLVIQFTQHQFCDEYDPTIEDSYRKQIFLNKQPVLLDILDCATEEEFPSFRYQLISSSQVLLLAFSITDRLSFEELERHYLPQHVLRNKYGKEQNKDFLIFLVGNKCDLEHHRVVNPMEGQSLAAKHGWKYFETSAKMRVNVDETFQAAAESWMRLNCRDEQAKEKPKKCSLQ